MKFEKIEDAQKAYDKQESELNKLKTAFEKQSGELKAAKQAQKTAEDAANDAIALANQTPSDPNKLYAKVGKSEYEVVFGVDGLTKEELAQDSKKLALLVESGSAALKLKEDK